MSCCKLKQINQDLQSIALQNTIYKQKHLLVAFLPTCFKDLKSLKLENLYFNRGIVRIQGIMAVVYTRMQEYKKKLNFH